MKTRVLNTWYWRDGHSQAKQNNTKTQRRNLTLISHLTQKLTQNGSWVYTQSVKLLKF